MSSPASSHAPISGPLSSRFDYQAASRPLKENRRRQHLHDERGSGDDGGTTEEESDDGRERRMLACKSEMSSRKQNCLEVGGPGSRSQPGVAGDPDEYGLENTIVRWDIINAARQAIDEEVQRQFKDSLPVEGEMISKCESDFVDKVSEVNDWAERLDLGTDSFLYKFQGSARITITPTVQVSVLVKVVPHVAESTAFRDSVSVGRSILLSTQSTYSPATHQMSTHVDLHVGTLQELSVFDSSLAANPGNVNPVCLTDAGDFW